MQDIIADREYKNNRILEEYNKRKTQIEVAEMFQMDVKHVSRVTQENNYRHTRKITQENRKEHEVIKPVTFFGDFEFLDQYPIENFK